MGVFESIRQQSLVPDDITYNACLSAYQQGQQPGWVMEVCQAMQRRGVISNVITMDSLLMACAAEGLWEKVLFEGSTERVLSLGMRSYSTLITECPSRDLHNEAVALSGII